VHNSRPAAAAAAVAGAARRSTSETGDTGQDAEVQTSSGAAGGAEKPQGPEKRPLPESQPDASTAVVVDMNPAQLEARVSEASKTGSAVEAAPRTREVDFSTADAPQSKSSSGERSADVAAEVVAVASSLPQVAAAAEVAAAPAIVVPPTAEAVAAAPVAGKGTCLVTAADAGSSDEVGVAGKPKSKPKPPARSQQPDMNSDHGEHIPRVVEPPAGVDIVRSAVPSDAADGRSGPSRQTMAATSKEPIAANIVAGVPGVASRGRKASDAPRGRGGDAGAVGTVLGGTSSAARAVGAGPGGAASGAAGAAGTAPAGGPGSAAGVVSAAPGAGMVSVAGGVNSGPGGMMPLDPNPGAIIATSTQDFWPSASSNKLIKVALNFQGKRKLVRHLGHTLVGDVLKLTQVAARTSRPLVLVDRDGFEVGANVPLRTLAQQGSIGGEDDILELVVQVDDWGEG